MNVPISADPGPGNISAGAFPPLLEPDDILVMLLIVVVFPVDAIGNSCDLIPRALGSAVDPGARELISFGLAASIN